ncbi:MAG TPA: hypothetical protein VFS67_23120 [Polyangiaceae bacterium]|nr:hypothetical protein [Polyangiaceae bacterium]
MLLRCVSEQPTEVDGQALAKGGELPVRPGTRVRVGRVATLQFIRWPAPVSGSSEDPAIGNR